MRFQSTELIKKGFMCSEININLRPSKKEQNETISIGSISRLDNLRPVGF